MKTLLSIILLAVASAQPVEVKSLFQPAPRWVDPAFNDSAWPTVPMPEATAQPLDGLFWENRSRTMGGPVYRTKVNPRRAIREGSRRSNSAPPTAFEPSRYDRISLA